MADYTLKEQQKELILRVKAGEMSLLPELWEKLQPLTRYLAGLFIRHSGGTGAGAFDFDDVLQEAWMVLQSAIQYWEPDAGHAFATIYRWQIGHGLIKTYGNKKFWYDGHISLDAAFNEEDPSSSLFSVLPDPQAEADLEDADARAGMSAITERLHGITHTKLTPLQQKIIFYRYFRELPQKRVAVIVGMTVKDYKLAESSALREFRKDPRLRRMVCEE